MRGRRAGREAWGEAAVIAALFLAFFVSGALSGVQRRIDLGAMYAGVLLSGGACAWSLRRYLGGRGGRPGGPRRAAAWGWEAPLLLAATALLRLGGLWAEQRWDGETYLRGIMNGCRGFDFTPLSYVDSFRLCGHTTLGYALFAAVGGYLDPAGSAGVKLVDLALYLFYTLFLYRIAGRVLPERSGAWRAGAVFVITSGPLALGTFWTVNVDMAVLVFSVYVLYMHMEGRHLLLWFFSGVLVQTKETGGVVLAGYMAAWLAHGLRTRGRSCLRDRALWAMLPAWGELLGYLALLRSRGLWLWQGGIRVGDGGSAHYFALVPAYVRLKLGMVFGMNFYWLSASVTAALLLLGWRRRAARRKGGVPGRAGGSGGAAPGIAGEAAGPLAGFCGGVAALLLFNCVYVTWSNPRYHYALEMFLLSVTTVLVSKEVRRGWARRGLLVLLGACCLAQSYTTVDGVTRALFGTRETGGRYEVAHPAWNAEEGEYQPWHVLADMAVYNGQMSYLDKAYDRLLSGIGYDGTWDVVVWDDLPQYNGLSTASMYRYWDAGVGRRRFCRTDATVPLRVIGKPWFEREGMDPDALSEEAVYVHTPGYGADEAEALEALGAYYEIGEREEVRVWGQGSVSYYRMRRRGVPR